jgi:RsiW-degrading membrane proteinase PrsW (M82 family)
MGVSLSITFLSGSQEEQSMTFSEGDEISIGRDKSNTIIFDGTSDNAVSRQHAVIQNKTTPGQDGEWTLTDQSTNGTYLNGNKLLNESFVLNDGDVLSFSKDRQDIKISISPMHQQEKQVDAGIHDTSPSFTKIVPTARPGFLKEVIRQPFFIPGIVTVITALLLFYYLQSGLQQQDPQDYFENYQTILGLYLGAMMIFFVRAISEIKIPLWFLLGTSLFTILLLRIEIPFYLLGLIFRSPLIDTYTNSNLFFEKFIGNFIGVGMVEELFKSIPLWLIIFFGPRFANMNLPGFINKKPNPSLAMLIGAASGIGFIVLETLIVYVPSADNPMTLAYGLMLLIPRFISGIAGHAAYSGIFAYFIVLGFYYKRINLIYPVIGWLVASLLHGLWNSSPDLGQHGVGICSFIIFMVFLFKAKKSFPT